MTAPLRDRLIERVYAAHKTLTRIEAAAILDTILAGLREPDEVMEKAGLDAISDAPWWYDEALAKSFTAIIDAVREGR